MKVKNDSFRAVKIGRAKNHRRCNLVAHSFTIWYYNHAFPVSPRSLDDLLGTAAERCQSDDLAFIAGAFGRLPHATATEQAAVRQRHRDKEVLRVQLARLCQEQPVVAAAIEAVVAEANATPDALDALFERQNYRLGVCSGYM